MNHSKASTVASPSLATTPLPVNANAITRERDGQWLLIAGGVLLGTIGVFVEEAGQHPLVTVWFRCAFGALALLAWCLATGRGQQLFLHGRARWVACATGVLMVLNWALFFAAIPRTSIAVATVIFHIQPIWVIVFGALFLREAVSPTQWLATLAALGGLVLTTGLLDGTAGVAAASSTGGGSRQRPRRSSQFQPGQPDRYRHQRAGVAAWPPLSPGSRQPALGRGRPQSGVRTGEY